MQKFRTNRWSPRVRLPRLKHSLKQTKILAILDAIKAGDGFNSCDLFANTDCGNNHYQVHPPKTLTFLESEKNEVPFFKKDTMIFTVSWISWIPCKLNIKVFDSFWTLSLHHVQIHPNWLERIHGKSHETYESTWKIRMHDQNEVIPQSLKFYLVQPFKGDITYHNMIFISNTWIQESYLIMSYHSHVISGFRRVPLRRKIKALIQQTVWTSFSGYKYYCWFKTSRTRWCGECRTIHRVSWITGDSPKFFHPQYQYWNPEKYGEKKQKTWLHYLHLGLTSCFCSTCRFPSPHVKGPPTCVNMAAPANTQRYSLSSGSMP